MTERRHIGLCLILAAVTAMAGCHSISIPIPFIDTDGDGIRDSDDACPGFDDTADADADGVADGCDPCPLDSPDDTDGDGVCDSDDACPGFDDTADADGDGVPDGCDTIVFAWPAGVPDLGVWLDDNPTVASALVWEGDPVDPSPSGQCGRSIAGPFCGEVMSWPWRDRAAQSDLFDAFVRAWLGEPSGVSDAPPNAAADTGGGDSFAHQEYSPEDGRAAFMAYAANSLAVEIGNHHVAERPAHMVAVGWSILEPGYTVAPESGIHAGTTPLAVLLDSRKTFYRQPDGNFLISMVAHGGMATMSAPETALAFLRGDALPYTDLPPYNCSGNAFDCSASLPLLVPDATPTETIARTIHWFRLNAIHFMNHWWYGNTEAHWQYRGYTPAVRIMTGTARTEYISTAAENPRRPTSADTRTIPRTAGCWGTTGFMHSVLRSVNIVVVLEPAGGHALPSFPTEASAGRPSHMSHGDDPYSALTKTSLHPSDALLMYKAPWEAWFRPPPVPGEPEPELLEPTNDLINEGFIDLLPDDLDFCGDGTDDCAAVPPPQPEPDPTGDAIENTPRLNVGRRARELSLSWTSWYVVNKYCDIVEAGGLELGDPVDSSEIALRNWTTEELSALDCSTLPVTGREDLFCHEDFFGYLGDVIVGEGGCSEINSKSTREEVTPSVVNQP